MNEKQVDVISDIISDLNTELKFDDANGIIMSEEAQAIILKRMELSLPQAMASIDLNGMILSAFPDVGEYLATIWFQGFMAGFNVGSKDNRYSYIDEALKAGCEKEGFSFMEFMEWARE